MIPKFNLHEEIFGLTHFYFRFILYYCFYCFLIGCFAKKDRLSLFISNDRIEFHNVQKSPFSCTIQESFIPPIIGGMWISNIGFSAEVLDKLLLVRNSLKYFYQCSFYVSLIFYFCSIIYCCQEVYLNDLCIPSVFLVTANRQE